MCRVEIGLEGRTGMRWVQMRVLAGLVNVWVGQVCGRAG